jgi:hypothetical protein
VRGLDMMQPLLGLRILLFPDSTVSDRTVKRDLGCAEGDVIQDVFRIYLLRSPPSLGLFFGGSYHILSELAGSTKIN